MPSASGLNFPDASTWSLLLGTIGRSSIVVAAIAALIAALLSIANRQSKIATCAFVLCTISFFVAFSILGSLFLLDQFHFQYVFGHSAVEIENRYKFAAIWSGQEGSFLLWAVCSSLFGILAISKTGEYRRWFIVPFAIFLACLAGILTYESPFRVTYIEGRALLPPTGMGLAPSLLNYWVTIHPPTIFLGFGSLAVPFCWAVSALLTGNLNDWIPKVRPWAIVSLTLLGLGLCMGGFWAYETLGWGGFWAWDPVENVSFVPWCLMVAFVHGAFIQAARRGWRLTNAILASAPFILFVYGTFLTRSGFLGDTSVHSFAQMERTALKLLIGLLAVAFLGFVSLVIWRARKLPKEDSVLDGPSDKRFAYSAAVWLLAAFAMATAFGMSVPLVMTLSGQAPKVVEPALYHKVLAWLILPLLLLMGAAPFLSWRGKRLTEIISGFSNMIAVTIGLLGFALIWIKRTVYMGEVRPADTIAMPFGFRMNLLMWMGILLAFCIWVVVCAVWKILQDWKRNRGSIGALLTHLGVVTALAGLMVSLGFEKKVQTSVRVGRPGHALDQTILYAGTTSTFDDHNNKVKLTFSGPNSTFVARPGLYLITDREGNPQPFLWPHVERKGFYDLYVSLGQPTLDATSPNQIPKGETRVVEDEDVMVKYLGYKRKGEPGVLGTKFIADLQVTTAKGPSNVTPMIEITSDGMKSIDAEVNDDMTVSLLGVDPANGSATLQFKYTSPLFPIEVFYKPGTVFVWVGAGIMTLGGFLAALSRARAARSIAKDPT